MAGTPMAMMAAITARTDRVSIRVNAACRRARRAGHPRMDGFVCMEGAWNQMMARGR